VCSICRSERTQSDFSSYQAEDTGDLDADMENIKTDIEEMGATSQNDIHEKGES
jgi:hypothetical protein